MNILFKRLSVFAVFLLFLACDTPGGNENTYVSIKTSMGDIKVRLYDGTPIHRDNFIKLVNQGIYDGISFHRVINEFMIQAGDPATRNGLTKEQRDTLVNYTIPSEFRKEYFHKKGALAAAREGNDVNPEMRSSGTQFYIVQGVIYDDALLSSARDRINYNIRQTLFTTLLKSIADSARLAGTPLSDSEIQQKVSLRMFEYLSENGDFEFSEAQVEAYKSIGGVPRLDGTYTVFGEVVEGLEVVDRIAAVKTDSTDRPLNDVRILKMKISD